MFKKILLTLGILFALTVVGVSFLKSNMGTYLRAAVEVQGTLSLRVPVRMTSIKIFMLTAEAMLRGLSVNNPADFTEGRAFYFGQAVVKVSPQSVVGNGAVVVDQVTFDKPLIIYEKNAEGRVNLDLLMQNAAEFMRSPKADARRKVIIKNLEWHEGKVVVVTPNQKGARDIRDLPDVSIQNFGAAEGGLTPDELVHQLMVTFSEKAAEIARVKNSDAQKLTQGKKKNK